MAFYYFNHEVGAIQPHLSVLFSLLVFWAADFIFVSASIKLCLLELYFGSNKFYNYHITELRPIKIKIQVPSVRKLLKFQCYSFVPEQYQTIHLCNIHRIQGNQVLESLKKLACFGVLEFWMLTMHILESLKKETLVHQC